MLLTHTQRRYLEYTAAAEKIIQPLDIPDSGLSDLSQQIQQVELIVPVVGGFSAGKSTLINSFLDRNILPTAVTPETALATELRYSEEDYIEAVTKNEAIEKYALEDFPSLKDNAHHFKLLRVYLNHPNLKAIAPLVLVDMPGFDAPIENHNQAILSYLSRGVYFVFLTSVEDGTITLSMKREIENLQRIGKGFSFCISKTNLRPEGQVNEVKTQIKEQLDDLFDYTDDVILLDQNGGENLKRILAAISPELLFKALFQDNLRHNYYDLVQSLNVKLSTFTTSQKEAEETMNALQQGIQNMYSKKDAAVRNVEKHYSDKNINNITNKVISDLTKHIPHLTDLAMQNPDAFSREINDLVKNSLLTNVQESLTSISSELIQDFSSHLQSSLDNNAILDRNFVDRIGQVTQGLLNSARGGLVSLTDKFNEKASESGSSIYRAIATVMGLTTNIVSPILEIIVIFLPNIINYFTKESRERKAREQIEQKIVGEIIPQLRHEISQNLPALFNERVRELITEVSQQFETQLAQKQAEIEKASAEKQQYANEIAQKIESLNQAISDLKSLANQYLFDRKQNI
ncbi:dynamin family protein [Pasteurella sp. PK-2025]|uniref:dynamin family protein n=1 Tax=Pasteurella sp. PK-2025 TaxID=3413133 RepID=UPI003C787B93